ncbi:MAG: site-specific DNA-methyltransferase [Caldilineae bacterium]|nr:site-specific DNA-methyltransferase [Anaerolineae bacterium]MCB0254671.1 site-specific DNA-methyltransferase [Anaerolineae bacterium]MCB9152610.1 site-specific DNA-methyltransferase [Caldilineae bacterium]
MKLNELEASYSMGFETISFERSLVVLAGCFDWMARVSEESIQAVVTDPPYGVKEYDHDQLQKRSEGNGGVWRIPPAFDGNVRSPLPRFTALNDQGRTRVREFFAEWARLLLRVMVPGGHVFLASNAFLSQIVFNAIADAGFEFRGEIIRLVRTLRGGDRPKNAEHEFPDVCSLPRGCYEPWGLFRKPLPSGMTVSACLAEYGTGGLRRKPNGKPFEDVISSERTPKRERTLANHPSLKPQSFLRQVVYASLPLGTGVVLDPFMGSGSTVAAAEFLGYNAIGLERRREYFEMSRTAVRDLSILATTEDQLSFSFA